MPLSAAVELYVRLKIMGASGASAAMGILFAGAAIGSIASILLIYCGVTCHRSIDQQYRTRLLSTCSFVTLSLTTTLISVAFVLFVRPWDAASKVEWSVFLAGFTCTVAMGVGCFFSGLFFRVVAPYLVNSNKMPNKSQ